MQTRKKPGSTALLFTMVLGLAVGWVAAQDPVKVAPDLYKTVLENEDVRVGEVTLRPGAQIATHRHADQLLYFMSGGKLKLTYPDGKTRKMHHKSGDTVWISAETHTLENAGTTEVKAAVIELKKPPQSNDSSGKATVRVLFENERVRALDVRVKPGGNKPMHPAYLFYALSDLKFTSAASDDKPGETTLSEGQAAWSEPITRSSGTNAAHVLIVELKDPGASAGPGEFGTEATPAGR